jgi:8-oxo-dGTP pyrophosphatase MutT (NUDIX family)
VTQEKELPTLRGESLYVPFVGAIIERKPESGQKQVLIQTRIKSSDVTHSGTFEIPGGKMRAFEDIFDTVRREVKEETGLDVTEIIGEGKRIDCSNKGDVSTLIEPFCVTQMQTGPFIGIIFLCSAVGKLAATTDETCEIRWVDVAELKRLVDQSPERFYTPFLGPLKKYLALNTAG